MLGKILLKVFQICASVIRVNLVLFAIKMGVSSIRSILIAAAQMENSIWKTPSRAVHAKTNLETPQNIMVGIVKYRILIYATKTQRKGFIRNFKWSLKLLD